jgi:hypothetical protein
MKRLKVIISLVCVIIIAILCVLFAGVTKHPAAWDSVRNGEKKSDVYSTIGRPEFHSETGYDEWEKNTLTGFWRLRVFYHDNSDVGNQSNLVVAVIERSFKWRIPR